MPWRRLGWSALGALILAGAVVWWRAHFRETVEQARRATGELLADTQPESIPDGALYQRFRARRDAVDSMRLLLRRLVAAESAYWADSSKYTTNLGTGLRSVGSVVGPTILLTRDGWWGWVSSVYAQMTCKVYVGGPPPDTGFGAAEPGQPVCTGEHAASYP